MSNPWQPKASNKGPVDQCPIGNHPGVLIGLIDLGTHWESFQGAAEKKVRKVFLVWEVEAENDGKDRRYWVGKDYNMTVDEKSGEVIVAAKSALRQLLEGWRGKPYQDGERIDIAKVHNQPCLVNVAHEEVGSGNNKRTYARVKGVAALPKGTPKLKNTRPPMLYVADSEEPAPTCPEGDEWLPRIFGARVDQVLERCLEWGGTGRREKKEGANGHPAGTQGGPPAESTEEIPF
mgnify:CR=1 FL=1